MIEDKRACASLNKAKNNEEFRIERISLRCGMRDEAAEVLCIKFGGTCTDGHILCGVWRSSPKILGQPGKGKVAASPVVLGIAGSLPAARRQRAPVVGGSAGSQWRGAAAVGGSVARCAPVMRGGATGRSAEAE